MTVPISSAHACFRRGINSYEKVSPCVYFHRQKQTQYFSSSSKFVSQANFFTCRSQCEWSASSVSYRASILPQRQSSLELWLFIWSRPVSSQNLYFMLKSTRFIAQLLCYLHSGWPNNETHFTLLVGSKADRKDFQSPKNNRRNPRTLSSKPSLQAQAISEERTTV